MPIALWSLLAWVSTPGSAAPYDDVRSQLLQGEPSTKVLDRLLDAEDRNIRDGLVLGTPEDRRERLAPLAASTSRAITAHLAHAPADRDAARLALRTILRRKGQLVDAEYATLQTVRQTSDAEGLALLEDLVAATRRLDERSRRRQNKATRELRAEIGRLQRELATKSRTYRSVAGFTTLDEVASTLDRRTLLVEIVAYRPWDVKTDQFGALHYAVYTLDRSGSILGADVGPTEAIDDDVLALRGTLIARRDAAPLADALRARLFGDLPWVTRATHLVIAADGLLGHVPFEIVLAKAVDDEFHVPRVSYLTSGRERTQLGAWKAEPSEPVVVYGVDYGPGTTWSPLPGTLVEGEAVATKIEGARRLVGPAATEAAVLALSRPSLLHIATHGFFASQADPSVFEPFSRGLLPVAQGALPVFEERPVGETEHPALRSGLVFAGANDGGGIVTAAEWSNLDLRGTRLVVLSACETGLGEIRNGDGVHGLRRALVLAGSQSQVLSLWKVDDTATAALMTEMYARLAAGANVGDALHQSKLAMARQPAFRHPFFWAAFTLSGRASVKLP